MTLRPGPAPRAALRWLVLAGLLSPATSLDLPPAPGAARAAPVEGGTTDRPCVGDSRYPRCYFEYDAARHALRRVDPAHRPLSSWRVATIDPPGAAPPGADDARLVTTLASAAGSGITVQAYRTFVSSGLPPGEGHDLTTTGIVVTSAGRAVHLEDPGFADQAALVLRDAGGRRFIEATWLTLD